MNETPTDQAAVVAELTAEADRQRIASTAAAIDEADVIAAFDDLAPAGATGDDGAAVIARLGSVAHVNVDVPVGSNQAALVPVKKGLRKLQAWYLRYVVDQINIALGLTVGALEDHERRLRSLDSPASMADVGVDASPPLSETVILAASEAAHTRTPPSVSAGRRVLNAWCGRGEIVSALVSSKVDAYGIDPDSESVSVALRGGLDVRNDDPLEHLAEIPAGSLSGLVLGQAIDLMKVAEIAEVLDLGRRAVAEGGPIVILADTEPVDAARFQLAERPPLSAEAWRRLIKARCLTVEADRPIPGDLTVFVSRR